MQRFVRLCLRKRLLLFSQDKKLQEKVHAFIREVIKSECVCVYGGWVVYRGCNLYNPPVLVPLTKRYSMTNFHPSTELVEVASDPLELEENEVLMRVGEAPKTDEVLLEYDFSSQ